MSSSPIPEQLADALRERIAVVADREFFQSNPSRHLERLKSVSEKIAFIQTKLPPSLEPRLAHYLQRCSYEKALALLEGDAPNSPE